MILTLPVLLYQLLFVAILYVASRLGRVALGIAIVACLAWTSTHLFFVPLAVLQASVILITGSFLMIRLQRRAHPALQRGAAAGDP